MRVPRIYDPAPLAVGNQISLSEEGSNHVGRVLRMGVDDALILFNGDGNDYSASITQVTKRSVEVVINGLTPITNESPLKIHLGQVISRGEKMDFTLQKAVELGVTEITPLFSERCGVKLNNERLDKKVEQWQKIVISACEQCGRAFVPKVNEPQNLEAWLGEETEELKLNLHPRASLSIATLPKPEQGVRLVIGPEGGLSASEIDLAAELGFIDMLLGPRVLRTETAALTAITALQTRFGDLG